MNETKINALIELLDDPDETVYGHISREIITEGHRVVPRLERAWLDGENPLQQTRIEELIHEIHFNWIRNDLEQWVKNKSYDLVEASVFPARYHYPQINAEDEITEPIGRLSRQVWLELNDNLTPLEQVKVLNRVFFSLNKFTGSPENNFAIRNFFLNDVLRTRKGNAYSMSLLYLVIAQMNNLPVMGVNLPGHPLLCSLNRDLTPDRTSVADFVSFYIDPSAGGNIFGKNDIMHFLAGRGVEPNPKYYIPASNRIFFQRCLSHLALSYQKIKQATRVKEINCLIDMLKSKGIKG
ncbi:MAG: hypothetical protein HYY40_11470 [Bacteroidetes bacterium]|nr:hypothetical protein [Bacteroidota bacterium]